VISTGEPPVEREVRRTRRWPIVLGTLVAAAVLFAVVFELGQVWSRSTPIPLVEIRQQYGTLAAGADADHRCIQPKDGEAQVCGRLRLKPSDRVPALGVPVRGGYTEVPSDRDDEGPEPSFLWLTQMQS